MQETETLRESLSAARLEIIEARNLAARMETSHGEAQIALAAKSAEAERLLRENEMLAREAREHVGRPRQCAEAPVGDPPPPR